MLAGVVEKLGFGVPAFLLYQAGRIKMEMFFAGAIDLALAVFFTIAWVCLEGARRLAQLRYHQRINGSVYLPVRELFARRALQLFSRRSAL